MNRSLFSVLALLCLSALVMGQAEQVSVDQKSTFDQPAVPDSSPQSNNTSDSSSKDSKQVNTPITCLKSEDVYPYLEEAIQFTRRHFLTAYPELFLGDLIRNKTQVVAGYDFFLAFSIPAEANLCYIDKVYTVPYEGTQTIVFEKFVQCTDVEKALDDIISSGDSGQVIDYEKIQISHQVHNVNKQVENKPVQNNSNSTSRDDKKSTEESVSIDLSSSPSNSSSLSDQSSPSNSSSLSDSQSPSDQWSAQNSNENLRSQN